MMVAQRPRRTREVTGPTPHSVAIYARPTNKRPPEHLILDRRKQEDARQQMEELTKYNKVSDLKNDWERWTDRKIQLNTVKRRVTSLMQSHQHSIEDRREKLRNMLAQEDDAYLAEMESKQETVLERQAKMRERAKSLKEKRESERLDLVQTKLEQQWREQCEELRSTMSKRQQDEVAAERIDQLRIKAHTEQQRQEEDKMFADLWYADMMSKAKREEAETKRQMSANMETLGVLNKQMAAIEVKKQEELKLKEEEAILLREQARIRELEEKRAAEEKRRKQAETRHIYSRSIRMKREKEAREEQEQLAFDMKILEQLLEDSRNEAMEQTQRKKELREEDRRYREYLRQLKLEEAAFERDLDQLIDAEVEKTWQKKLAQWRLEKQARQKLLEDVLQGRKKQVEYKLRINADKLEEAAREKEDLNRFIEENRRVEAQQDMQRHSKHNAHQQDLLAQMDFNRRQRQLEWNEEERICSAQRDAEHEYRRKLEEALASDFVDKMHPTRRHALGRRALSANDGPAFMH